MVMDITARQQVEEARQKEAAMAASLARVGGERVTLLNTPMLLSRLCQLAAEEVQCDACHACLWQPQDAVYLPIAGWGNTPEQWEAVRRLKLPGECMTNLVARLVAEEVVLVT